MCGEVGPRDQRQHVSSLEPSSRQPAFPKDYHRTGSVFTIRYESIHTDISEILVLVCVGTYGQVHVVYIICSPGDTRMYSLLIRRQVELYINYNHLAMSVLEIGKLHQGPLARQKHSID